MRRNGTARSLRAICLLSLQLALVTGLPSHNHDHVAPPSDPGTNLVSTDHHAHGTLLIETDDRKDPGGPRLVAAPAVLSEPAPVARTTRRFFDAAAPVPQERAPPSSRPRAPPLA
jgi:hypothetical protein